MNSPAVNVPIRLVVIGDSWNAGYDDLLKADTGGWAAMLPKDRFAVKNLSVSGSTAEQWANNFGSRLAQAVALFDECDCYVVSLGGNDAFAYLSENSDGGAAITQAERERGIASLVKVLQALRATGKRVLVMQYANPYSGNIATAAGCDVLNLAIRWAGRTAKVGPSDYICSSTVLSEQGMMSGVGIHPTPLGYAALSKLIEGMVS